jgi:hypothetical protein
LSVDGCLGDLFDSGDTVVPEHDETPDLVVGQSGHRHLSIRGVD